MALKMRVVAVTDDAGGVIEPGWLVQAEAVHRQLRPQLPVAYVSRLSAVFANGACMAPVSYTHLDVYKRQGMCSGRLGKYFRKASA